MAFGTGKVWGLDLGRSAVKGVLLRKIRDGVEILKTDIEPLHGQPSPSINDPSRDKRLWEALKRFQERNRIVRERVVIAIPGQNTFNRNIVVARVGNKSLDELIQYEAGNEIPFVLDEVVWDYHLFPAPRDSFELSGSLFAVKKVVITTYLHMLQQSGFSGVDDITLTPVGLLNFLWGEIDRNVSSMIIDVGAEMTNMVAMAGDRFWFRGIASGGSKVTQLIEREFDIPFEQAEQAKYGIANSRFAEQIVQTILPSMHDFVAQVRLGMTYFQEVCGQAEFDRVYLVGGGSQLLGLRKSIAQSLGREPEDIRRLEHIFVSSQAGVETVRSDLQRLCVAIGASMQGLRLGATRVSFVPSKAAKRAEVTRKRPWVVASLFVIAALLATLFAFERVCFRRLEPVEDKAHQVDKKYQDLGTALAAARDNTFIRQELNLLYRLGDDKARIPEFLLRVTDHFAKASGGGPYQFRLFSFKVAPGEQGGAIAVPESKPALRSVADADESFEPASGLWYLVEVEGVMKLPKGGEAGQAYDNLDALLINAMKNDPFFAKLNDFEAKFTLTSKKVVGTRTKFKQCVRANDWIKLDKDGIWYRVGSVDSDTELTLVRAFEGQTLQGKAMICRVVCDYFDRKQLSFKLSLEVPKPAAPTIALR